MEAKDEAEAVGLTLADSPAESLTTHLPGRVVVMRGSDGDN